MHRWWDAVPVAQDERAERHRNQSERGTQYQTDDEGNRVGHTATVGAMLEVVGMPHRRGHSIHARFEMPASTAAAGFAPAQSWHGRQIWMMAFGSVTLSGRVLRVNKW